MTEIKKWFDRIEWPDLPGRNKVEVAMLTEIAELRAALAHGEPVAWHPTEAAIAALKRFAETCEDDEGYDVPKDTMRNLQAIGLIYRTHGSVYCITDYGHHMLVTKAQPAREPTFRQMKPCKCFDEVAKRLCMDRNDCSRIEALVKGATE